MNAQWHEVMSPRSTAIQEQEFPSGIALFSSKPRIKDISQYWFLNNENYIPVSEHIGNVSKKVSECLMSEKAIIHSEMPLRSIASSFPIEEFPSIGNGVIDFSSVVLEKWPVVNFWSPNFFGQMHPARNLPAIIASHVSTMLNQNLIAEEVSPIFTQMENQTIGYLADIIGYDINRAGWSVITWGTQANRTTIMVARNKTLNDASDDGIYDALQKYNEINGTSYKDIQILSWEDNHYSIQKNAGDVWIGRKKVVKIPYKTGEFTLDMNHLKGLIEQAEKDNKLIVGIFITAGTTEKWHIHDIAGVIDMAKNDGQNGREIYVHVDAAHGGWFLVDDNMKNRYFKSIEKADSVTIDGHKMFYTNYACGCIIFKDKNSQNYLEHSASYIMDENSSHEDHGRYTLEWSRWTAWVFQLWASIQSFGKNGYKTVLRKTLENTQIFRNLLEEADDFEILSGDSPLNLICFRYHPVGVDDDERLNDINAILKERMYIDGTYYVWNTIIDDKKCFRAVLMNMETKEENLIWFIEKVRELSK